MDSFYDAKAAKLALHMAFIERLKDTDGVPQLCKLFNETEPFRTLNVKMDGNVGRLIRSTDSLEGGDEELVAAFQGIICACNLPPVRRPLDSRGSQHARQRIAVTGLGDTTFDYVLSVINDIHTFFGNHAGGTKQQSSAFTSFGEFSALEAINRYFTPASQAGSDRILTFSSDIDPQGHLKMAAGDKFVHTDDNAVLYYRRVDDVGSAAATTVFESTTPALFSVGDIVEVQVSFVALPQKNNAYKLSLILRSISLLNNQYSKEASIRRFASQRSIVQKREKLILKRKVGYGNEMGQSSSTSSMGPESKRPRGDSSMQIDVL